MNSTPSLPPRALLIGSALALFAASSYGQPPASEPTLDLQTIMQTPEWIGRAPSNIFWSSDSRSVLFSRSTPVLTEESEENDNTFNPRDNDLFQVVLPAEANPTDPGFAEPISDAELKPLDHEQRAQVDAANTVRDEETGDVIFSRSGDLFWRASDGTLTQITRTSARENQPFLLNDGRLGFQRGGEVFARRWPSRSTANELPEEEELFRVETGLSPSEQLAKERKGWGTLGQDQPRLIDWVRDEQARADRRVSERALNAQLGRAAQQTFHLGEKLRPQTIVPSPDARFALVIAVPKQPPPQGDKMPSYVSESGLVEVRDVRPKVGSQRSGPAQVRLLDRQTGAHYKVDLGTLVNITEDPLKDLRAAAKQRAEERVSQGEDPKDSGARGQADSAAGATEGTEDHRSDRTAETKPQARGVNIGRVVWSPRGEHVVFQAYSRDNKDRWLATVELPRTDDAAASTTEWGALSEENLPARTLLHDHDPAWINWRYRDVLFVPGSERRLLALSERTGYSQLYTFEIPESFDDDQLPPVTALTSGRFVVDNVRATRDGEAVYFTSNANHPGNYEVFKVPTAGGEQSEITRLGGRNSFELSPDGQWLAILHGRTNHPPELYLQAAQSNATAQRVTRTVSPEFLAYDWQQPAVVEVPSSHVDRPIYARLFLPDAEVWGASDRPAVLFVHGAGYLQNAHLGWSSYFRETMFHTMLTQRGYVVLDMDYRGSAGYGRDWRTAIYRHMGGPEVEDLRDGVQYLSDKHGVDPNRVGVYGGSYGGFLTFMSMFTDPELFAAGAALRPVTDWAHYNHPYTSNILNTPELDPEAYLRSSPIEFAEGLEKPLLIASGMLDDNVFFQDSVRLVQRLIELEKQDWELAVYPVEPHGFREPSSWLDEYRRIFALFERHLKPAQP